MIIITPTARSGLSPGVVKVVFSVCESKMNIVRLDLTRYARSSRALVEDLRRTIARCKLPLHVAQRDKYYVYIFRKELVE